MLWLKGASYRSPVCFKCIFVRHTSKVFGVIPKYGIRSRKYADVFIFNTIMQLAGTSWLYWYIYIYIIRMYIIRCTIAYVCVCDVYVAAGHSVLKVRKGNMEDGLGYHRTSSRSPIGAARELRTDSVAILRSTKLSSGCVLGSFTNMPKWTIDTYIYTYIYT